MGKALTEAINRAKLVGFEIIKVNRDILTPYSDKQGYIARMDRGSRLCNWWHMGYDNGVNR